MNNPFFDMKSVIKCSYKAIVGAGPAPELELVLEPEPKLFKSRSLSGNKKFRLHNTGLTHGKRLHAV
jgi:hypothetical protein